MKVREGIGLVIIFAPLAFLVTMAVLVAVGPEWSERDMTLAISFFLAGASTAPLVTFLDRGTA